MSPPESLDEIVERLLEAPLHQGALPNPTVTTSGKNRLCGDLVTLTLTLKDEAIIDIKFETKGCVLCKAASALTTELVCGKTLDDVRNLDSEEILKALGSEINLRQACALLPLYTLKEGLSAYRSTGAVKSEHLLR